MFPNKAVSRPICYFFPSLDDDLSPIEKLILAVNWPYVFNRKNMRTNETKPE